MDFVIMVLAAGLSRRFGKDNKLLYDEGGETLIHRVVREASCTFQTRVVLGYESEKIREALKDLNVEFVYNPDYEKGQFTSTQAGARGLDKPFFIMLGDLSFVKRDNYICLSRLLENHDAVRPFYKGTPGHPVLLSPHMASVIEKAEPTSSVKKILEAYDVINFQGLDDSWIRDMDYPSAF